MRSINQLFPRMCQRFAAYATLGGLLLTAPTAFAQAASNAGQQPESTCPSTSANADPLSVEREIQWHGVSGWARACWVDADEQAKARVVLELQINGQLLVRHQVTASEEIEGQLDTLRFETTPFVLSDTGLTVALRLASRNRGAIIDDSFNYLWLYQFDGRALRRVFDMTAQESHDPRGCDRQCAPPSRSRSIVIVQAGAGHNGLRDLRTRQKSWSETANVKPRGGAPAWQDQRYFFDGNKYQAQN